MHRLYRRLYRQRPRQRLRPHPKANAAAARRRCLAGAISWAILAPLAAAPAAAGALVNEGFESGDATGWRTWRSPWGAAPVYDFAAGVDPYDGAYSLSMVSTSGSFGVYQELVVEPGAPLAVDWAWRGSTRGNGWWELIIVDAPYSYERADAPADHPESFVAEKWETGFGGPYPAPSAAWIEGSAVITPTSEVVTIILKCGSTEGGRVEAGFDAVIAGQDAAPGKRFLRGDCNADAAVNLTDAVAALNYLFLGHEAPPCLEACNPDADAAVNLTDAVAILNYLFGGGREPAAPYPACGVDDAPLATCEASQGSCAGG